LLHFEQGTLIPTLNCLLAQRFSGACFYQSIGIVQSLFSWNVFLCFFFGCHWTPCSASFHS